MKIIADRYLIKDKDLYNITNKFHIDIEDNKVCLEKDVEKLENIIERLLKINNYLKIKNNTYAQRLIIEGFDDVSFEVVNEVIKV